MDPNVVLPFLSSALSFVFAGLVFDQWLRRRQPFQFVWTLGLTWYGLATAMEFVGGAFGWSEASYRAWYLFGAFGVAAYLGLGTIFLLDRTRFGYFVAAALVFGGLISLLFAAARLREGADLAPLWIALIVGSCVAGGIGLTLVTSLRRVWVAPLAAVLIVAGSLVAIALTLTAALPAPGYSVDPATGVPNAEAFPAYLRMLTPPFNIMGGLALVFGALYSTYIFMPKRRVLRYSLRRGQPVGPWVANALVAPLAIVVNFWASLPGAVAALLRGRLNSRVPATILIAIGAFIPGLTSGLIRFGITGAHFIGELLGIVFIFLGFLVSIDVFSDFRLPFTRIVLARRDRRDVAEVAERS